MPESPKPGPPATERQKEYARELGITFSDEITRTEISSLIDAAQTAQEGERWNRLNELNGRESAAWNKLREEVLADVDAEDCRLSKASPSQIVEALSERGLAAVLITMPLDEVKDFGNLRGVTVSTTFGDDMTLDDVEAVILAYAGEIMNRKGMSFGDLNRRLEVLNRQLDEGIRNKKK